MDKKIAFLCVDPSINGTGLSLVTFIGKQDGISQFKVLDKTTLLLPRQRIKYVDKYLKKIDVLHLFKHAVDCYIEQFGSEYRIGWSVFESYSYGSTGQLADLGEMGGLFKYFLYTGLPYKVAVETITPMQVKTIIGGSGKAGKDVVRNSLEKYIPDYNNIVWNSFDESDSVAVGISYFLLMESHINEQK